jgi:hypothetical protein
MKPVRRSLGRQQGLTPKCKALDMRLLRRLLAVLPLHLFS